MIVRQPSARRQNTSGTLEGAMPILVIDEISMFSSQEDSFKSIDNALGIDQQVAWIEGTLNVSF
jgi:hypothetical protein